LIPFKTYVSAIKQLIFRAWLQSSISLGRKCGKKTVTAIARIL